jgi:hypothetical protein
MPVMWPFVSETYLWYSLKRSLFLMNASNMIIVLLDVLHNLDSSYELLIITYFFCVRCFGAGYNNYRFRHIYIIKICLQ